MRTALAAVPEPRGGGGCRLDVPPPGIVDVWWCDIARAGRRIPLWEKSLDAEERERASRFHFAGDRDRFVACRGALRELAARYLERDPSSVEISRDPLGKPYFPGADLRFNVSKTKGAAILAFAAGIELGVDVERIREDFRGDEIAGRFLAFDEKASLASLPERIRSKAFYRCWTAKEAYLKGRGDGLGFPLDGFSVSFSEDAPQRLRSHRDAGEIARWWLVPMTPAEGFVACLAVAGDRPTLRFREVAGS